MSGADCKVSEIEGYHRVARNRPRPGPVLHTILGEQEAQKRLSVVAWLRSRFASTFVLRGAGRSAALDPFTTKTAAAIQKLAEQHHVRVRNRHCTSNSEIPEPRFQHFRRFEFSVRWEVSSNGANSTESYSPQWRRLERRNDGKSQG